MGGPMEDYFVSF